MSRVGLRGREVLERRRRVGVGEESLLEYFGITEIARVVVQSSISGGGGGGCWLLGSLLLRDASRALSVVYPF